MERVIAQQVSARPKNNHHLVKKLNYLSTYQLLSLFSRHNTFLSKLPGFSVGIQTLHLNDLKEKVTVAVQ